MCLDIPVTNSSSQPSLPSTLPSNQSDETPSPGSKRLLIVPNAQGDCLVFLPAPVFVHTQDRSTPRPPRPTDLLDLDPNSPRARGLCRNFNIVVHSEDADVDRSVANVIDAFAKVYERAVDPDASPDPAVRNLQDAIDKMMATKPDEPDRDDSKQSVYGDIHREALKCLPDKIITTSHYRYVLSRLRTDRELLREQIETDRDMVATMDATLDALRPFALKGKGRDRG